MGSIHKNNKYKVALIKNYNLIQRASGKPKKNFYFFGAGRRKRI